MRKTIRQSNDLPTGKDLAKSASKYLRQFFSIGIFLSVIFLTSSVFVSAQDTVTGAFQGKISNNLTGAAIAGVSVEITNEQSGVTYGLISDSRGEFYQGLLAPGTYQIRVTITGFKPRLLRRPLNINYCLGVLIDSAKNFINPN